MRRLAPFVCLFLFCLQAAGESKVEIRPLAKKGLKFTRTTEIAGESKIEMKVGDSGMAIPMTAGIRAETKVAEEVVDAKDGSPLGLRRRYEKKSALTSSMMGMGPDKPAESPLTGRVITFTTKNGKVERSMDGGGADDDLLATEEIVDPMTAAVASGKPVAVGDTWQPDEKLAKAWLQSIFNGKEPQEAEVKCKLVEIAQKYGQKCARIEVTARMKVEMVFVGHPDPVLEATFQGDVYFGLTAGVPLAMDAKGHLKGDLEQRSPTGTEGVIPLDIPLDLTSKVKVGEADFK